MIPGFYDWTENQSIASILTNLSKEVSRMAKTMKKKVKKQVKKAEGKKVKDPKRVEAAKKAWETIRAKGKEKQMIK
jgi:hypothetical protein